MLLSVLREQNQINILCDQHKDKSVIKICIDEKCKKAPFLCQDCLNSQHQVSCLKKIFDLQEGIQRIAFKMENAAPQSTFSKYFVYFREFQGKESEQINSFETFIKEQKDKISKDIEKVREFCIKSLDNFKYDIISKMDEQSQIYKQNFETLKRLFNNDDIGTRYKELIKYSDVRILQKRLSQFQTSQQAGEFIQQLKNDSTYFSNSLKDEKYEAQSYRLQQLFLLLNSQTVSPPTYQGEVFQNYSVVQIESLLDKLSKKLERLFYNSIHHFPIRNFARILDGSVKGMFNTQPKVEKIAALDQQIKQIRNNIITPFSNYNFEQQPTNFISLPDDEVCVTTIQVLEDRFILYTLNDSTLRFKFLKSDEVGTEFEPLQLKTWIYCSQAVELQMFQEQEQQEEVSKIIALGGDESILLWRVVVSGSGQDLNVMLKHLGELKAQQMFRCTSLMSCQDGQTIICGDWEGQLFIMLAGQCVHRRETQTQGIISIAPVKDYMNGSMKFVTASRCDMELGGIIIWQIQWENKDRVELNLQRRIKLSQVRRMITLQTKPNHIVVANDKNKVIIWDIEKNILVKELEGGETPIQDIMFIESSKSFMIGVLNATTLRFIDQHEHIVSTQPVEDFGCQQCQMNFQTSKLITFSVDQFQFKLIFPKHLHSCRHEVSDHQDKCSVKSCFYVQTVLLNPQLNC